MGSSGEKKTRGVDEFANGLVWVRRRNGSWWPGRVLGPDELPESCLTTPRSGTPVKLLGREDASVDWYNLEKSIRIKSFRCGEYDRCIESAKASAAGSFKRGVKYARREDAILHALEIESAGQSNDQADIYSNVDKPSNEEVNRKKSHPLSLPDVETNYMAEELISSKDKPMLGYELSHSGVSFEETNMKEQSSQGMRRKTPNDSEDDGTERMKRMKGIDDLGIGVDSSAKRKRSLNPNVHAFLKKKNRSRQLTKVLESTAMVKVPVICEPVSSPTESSILGVSDSKVSGLESIESKGSLSMVINNNSDSTGENGTSFNASEQANDALLISCKQKENEISSTGQADGDSSNRLFNVTLVGEDLAGFTSVYVPCATQKPQVAAGAQSSQRSQVETVPLMNEELNESGSTSSGATNTDVIDSEIKEGSSKWMLKGKRNLRNSSKSRKQGFEKPIDDKSNDCLAVLKPVVVGAALVSNDCTFQIKSEPMTDAQVNEVQGWGTHILHKNPQMMVPKAELATSQRLLPYRQSRYTMNPKYQSSDFTPRVYDPDSNLYNVKVEVKASCHPRHVPYISLMSKLTGQPIIGHPLTVEALGDGSCGILISSSECHDDEDVNGSEGLDMVYEQKPNRRGRKISRKRRLQLRYSTSKSPKSRKNGLLPKKIRKLSSITGSHKDNVEVKKPVVQKVKGPSISCVPLKVVFSRINAAIN